MSFDITYEKCINELNSQKELIDKDIKKIRTLEDSQERKELIRSAENKINELEKSVRDYKSNSTMASSNDRPKIEKAIREYETIIANLTNELRRPELFGNHYNLEGGSSSQRQSMQRDTENLRKTGDTLDSAINLGNQINSVADDIKVNLTEQMAKLIHTDSTLTEMDQELQIGGKTIDRMKARERRKTIIVWVVIILCVVIFLSVFLYFVFKP